MDCSTPGFPVHHQLPEFAQTHVHPVSEAIQPFHPLSSPYPPAFNLAQHQGLFQIVSYSHQVAKLSELQLPSSEHWGLIPLRIDWLDLLAVQEYSRVFSNTIVQKHQFFGAQLSLWSNSHPYVSTGKTIALTRWTFAAKWCLCLFIHSLALS